MNKILFGILIPAAVFTFSFIMTYLLYRHFSKGGGALSPIEKKHETGNPISETNSNDPN
jgi:hypothetical protein